MRTCEVETRIAHPFLSFVCRCQLEVVLTTNPSYAEFSASLTTGGDAGVLPRDQCAKLCILLRECVAFKWKSTFACTTYSACDNGLASETGLAADTHSFL